jgi:hypothetical protein
MFPPDSHLIVFENTISLGNIIFFSLFLLSYLILNMLLQSRIETAIENSSVLNRIEDAFTSIKTGISNTETVGQELLKVDKEILGVIKKLDTKVGRLRIN